MATKEEINIDDSDNLIKKCQQISCETNVLLSKLLKNMGNEAANASSVDVDATTIKKQKCTEETESACVREHNKVRLESKLDAQNREILELAHRLDQLNNPTQIIQAEKDRARDPEKGSDCTEETPMCLVNTEISEGHHPPEDNASAAHSVHDDLGLAQSAAAASRPLNNSPNSTSSESSTSNSSESDTSDSSEWLTDYSSDSSYSDTSESSTSYSDESFSDSSSESSSD